MSYRITHTIHTIGISDSKKVVGLLSGKLPETYDLSITSYDVLLDDYEMAITKVEVVDVSDTNYVDVTVVTEDGDYPDSRKWQLLYENGDVLRDWQDANVFEDVLKNQKLVAVVEDEWEKGDVKEFISNPSETTDYATFSATQESGRDGDIQTLTIDEDAFYEITAHGAQGGTGGGAGIGGLGAKISAEFSLKNGDVFNVLVGQRGESDNMNTGGGGGTFIVKDTPDPDTADILVIAGGGGAFANSDTDDNNHIADAQTEEDGKNGYGSYDTPGVGGQDGNGGSASSNGAGGGGGFLTGGQGGGSGTDAQSYLEGGVGGLGGSNTYGGFGCGGQGSTSSSFGSAGGGGGFSGGGGGYSGSSTAEGAGGGGGSFVNPNGKLLEALDAVREGAGLVEVTKRVIEYYEEPTTITDVQITQDGNDDFFAEVIIESIYESGFLYQLEDTLGNVIESWQESNQFGPLTEGNEYVARVKDVSDYEDTYQFVATL
ncbi:MAG: hypothetical protein ACOCUK_02370 [bacterium]